MRPKPSRLLLLPILIILSTAARAHAQPLTIEDIIPGVQLEPLTLDQAHAEARRTHRLLVVFEHAPGHPPPDFERIWKNPTVSAYLHWHCLAIQLQRPGSPAIRVYKDGRLLEDLSRRGQTFGNPSAITGRPPTPLMVLSRLDIAMERLRASDPAWYMLHERANPMPRPPPRQGPFYKLHDEAAAAVEDPPDEDGPIDLWDRLETARRAVRVGNLDYATGLYTWLWERAHELDPAFAPARRAFLAAEMAEIARRRPESLTRFQAMRNAEAARLPWATFDDLRQFAILNAVVNEEALTIEYFLRFLLDPDEEAIIPTAHRIGYQAILARDRFGDPWELGEDPVAELRRLTAILRRPRPVISPHEEWEELRAFLRTLILEEGCRLHAACLAAGRETDAQQVIALILQTDDSPATRRALITTALFAGHPRPIHARLLDQLEIAGAPAPDLRARLDTELAAYARPPTGTPR